MRVEEHVMAPGIKIGEAPDAFDVDVGVITTSRPSSLPLICLQSGKRTEIVRL